MTYFLINAIYCKTLNTKKSERKGHSSHTSLINAYNSKDFFRYSSLPYWSSSPSSHLCDFILYMMRACVSGRHKMKSLEMENELNSDISERNIASKICPFFKYGYCKFGETCRLSVLKGIPIFVNSSESLTGVNLERIALIHTLQDAIKMKSSIVWKSQLNNKKTL